MFVACVIIIGSFLLAVSFIGAVTESAVRHDAKELDLDLNEYLDRKGIR